MDKKTLHDFGAGISRYEQYRDWVFPLMLMLAIGVAFSFCMQGWTDSLLQQHPFRQTQTAITVQYLLKGGNLIRYETPVFGPPWSIPMEFPLYQYLVYLLIKMTGYDLELSGRVVSFGFYLTIFYPLYILSRPFFPDRFRTIIVLALFCSSPEYLYWSRTFMIESTALALSVWYLYFVRSYLEIDSSAGIKSLHLVVIMVTGMLAAMTKVTTFFVYYLIGGLYLFLWIRNAGIDGKSFRYSREKLPFMLATLVLPFMAAIAWTRYSDYVKDCNPFGAYLQSANLTAWNFGTLDQKLNLHTWLSTLSRSISDIAGNFKIFCLLFCLLPLCTKRTVRVVLILLLLYLLPIVVFTNLYYVHNYYSYANGIILILAIALILSDLSMKGVIGHFVSLILLVLIVTTDGYRFYLDYLPLQGTQFRYQETKRCIDTHTQDTDVLVFFGADWSSEMPFYLEKRSSMFPDWLLKSENYRKAIANLKPYQVGAVLFCEKARNDVQWQQQKLIDLQLPSGGENIRINSCNIYFPPR
jgi:hypothetical protein